MKYIRPIRITIFLLSITLILSIGLSGLWAADPAPNAAKPDVKGATQKTEKPSYLKHGNVLYLPHTPSNYYLKDYYIINTRAYFVENQVVAVEFQNWSSLYKFLVVEVQATTDHGRTLVLSNILKDQPVYNQTGLDPVTQKTYYFDFSPLLIKAADDVKAFETKYKYSETYLKDYKDTDDQWHNENILSFSVRWGDHDLDYIKAKQIANQMKCSEEDFNTFYNQFRIYLNDKLGTFRERFDPQIFEQYFNQYIVLRLEEKAELEKKQKKALENSKVAIDTKEKPAESNLSHHDKKKIDENTAPVLFYENE